MADIAAQPARTVQRTRGMRPRRWLALDAAVALMFLLPFGSRELRRPAYQNPWLSLLLLGVSLAFLARRRYPMTVCLLLTAATVVLATAEPPYDSYGPFAMMFVLYTVATTHSGALTTLASVSVFTAALLILNSMHYPSSVTALSGVAIGIVPSLIGYLVRQQRLYRTAMSAVRARKIEVEVRSRMAEERLLIARELHDVVAHALSLITVQAGVAVFRQHEAGEMRAALTAIEETGRGAMGDMRELLGVLRSAQPSDTGAVPPPDRQPIPSLLDLGTLVSQAAQAGLRISLREEGERRAVSSSVGLAVYRVVQESLTNILRHARTTSGEVLVRFEPQQLTVTIANPPPRDDLPPIQPNPPGLGLRGMAERAEMFGGAFTAGPTEEGGFAVTARFPG